MKHAVNFPDDSGPPGNAYFKMGFSKIDRHNIFDLLFAATKVLTHKLKVKNLKRLCFLERTLSQL